LLAATKGLSYTQWKFKPAPERWSVAEVLEHIVVAEGFLLENTSTKVMEAPAGKPDRDYKSVDKLVVSAIADRTQRAQAPEPVQPKDRWSPEETVYRFLKIRKTDHRFPELHARLAGSCHRISAWPAPRRVSVVVIYLRAQRAAYQANPRDKDRSKLSEK